MKISKASGAKVQFTGFGGHPGERERALNFLTVGAVYTTVAVEDDQFNPTVSLEEIPGRHFNAALFRRPVSPTPCVIVFDDLPRMMPVPATTDDQMIKE